MKRLIFVWIVISLRSPLLAQVNENGQEPLNEKKWGIETSILWPAVNLYQLKLTRLLHSSAGIKGNLLTGYALVNNIKTDYGRLLSHHLLLGYRFRFWKGLHCELILYPTYSRVESSIDGRVYKTFVMDFSLLAGYVFAKKFTKFSLYLLPQAGIGGPFYTARPYPTGDAREPHFVPNVCFGVNF